MTTVVAGPVAPAIWQPTTAQLVIQSLATPVSDLAPLVGISLHQFTDLVVDRIGATTLDLHRFTTILTKQMQVTLGTVDMFVSLRSLVTDPRRVAGPDGRSAADVCGSSWNQVRLLSDDRARAAIDGARRFGEKAVIQLAVLHTTQCAIPWWGTTEWEQRVDAWARTIRFAPRLKRVVRQTPELIDADLLLELISD